MRSTVSRLSVLVVGAMAILSVCLTAAATSRHTVTIKDMQYSPATIEVRVGDTVVWNNTDDRDHTVVADDGSFNSGNIRSGSSFSHTFAKAGSFAYGCKYHPRMRGTVVVKE